MFDRVASVSIASGKAEQIGNVDVQDDNVEIVSRRADGGGTRKCFWRLAEKEELTVTVRLPAGAKDVSARILMDASVKQGEAHLAWNGKTIGGQEKQLVLRSGDGGRNRMNVYLDDLKPVNQIKLIGTKGEIDIAAVEFRYRVPCPSWENDNVRMTLLEPEPDSVIAKDSKAGRIDLRWTASGPMEPGWIKIEYREPGKYQWTAVPGAEGISFGSKEWSSAMGAFTWHYDGNLPNLEFRVLFNRGANPIEEMAEAARYFLEGGTVAGGRAVLTISGVEYAFRFCPSGSFMMGSPASEAGRDADETQHCVTLARGFWMLETEVTQEMWESVMGSNPSRFKGKKLPVESVSWNDCQEFIRKLNQQLNRQPEPRQSLKFSLPTEAQWEYACRAGTTGSYGGTGVLDVMGWYDDNSGSKTHIIGQKKPNAWGLYDMHGNVWEWCSDWLSAYPSGSVTDPVGPSTDSRRVYRGGGWCYCALLCRSAFRSWFVPSFRFSFLGVRLSLVSD